MSPADLDKFVSRPPGRTGNPRESLDRKLNQLLDEIIVLEGMVEGGIIEAVTALLRHDMALARNVYDFDQRVNSRRFSLENDVINTIATGQPIMAGDLRLVASILEVAGELERIGDYAKGIAKVCMLVGDQAFLPDLPEFASMRELVTSMLNRAIYAFVNQDVAEAQLIPVYDNKVDALYNQIYRKLIDWLTRYPQAIDHGNYLMWAGHNLERIADRVTNICERTIYAVTGKLIEFDSEG